MRAGQVVVFVVIGFQQFCQAEICDLHSAAFIQEYVFRLDVAVDNALVVSKLQRVAEVRDDSQRFFRSDAAGGDGVSECDPVNEFHHEVKQFIDLSEVVAGDDVRVVELCQRPDFSQETVTKTGVALNFLRQNLDGHEAAEVRLTGFVNSTHSSPIDQFKNFQIREQRVQLLGFGGLETLLFLF